MQFDGVLSSDILVLIALAAFVTFTLGMLIGRRSGRSEGKGGGKKSQRNNTAVSARQPGRRRLQKILD
jgi:hypothetical protein